MEREDPPRGVESVLRDDSRFGEEGAIKARIGPGSIEQNVGLTSHRQEMEALAPCELDIDFERNGRSSLVGRGHEPHLRAQTIGERTPAGARLELQGLSAEDEAWHLAKTLGVGDAKGHDPTVPLNVLRSHTPATRVERRKAAAKAQIAAVENDLVDRAVSDFGLEAAADLERLRELMHPHGPLHRPSVDILVPFVDRHRKHRPLDVLRLTPGRGDFAHHLVTAIRTLIDEKTDNRIWNPQRESEESDDDKLGGEHRGVRKGTHINLPGVSSTP